MQLRLGIDIACRAAHQASLADEQGNFVWTGRRFRTGARDLERLWAMLPTVERDVTVIMEPTRNAWVPLAAWFRRQGARVVLVPPERSSDLRAYYSKHTKTDRLDSRLLARLPLLHPEGLHEEQGLGPGDPLRRATRLHQTLTKRRSKSLARLDALLEILGPAWLGVFGADLSNKTPLRFLAACYACPNTVKRLGKARLARFLYRHSRGRWGQEQAEALTLARGSLMMIRRVLAVLVLSALTACGRSTPSTGTEGLALPKGLDAAEPGQQWTDVIGGVPTTLADAASVVPFTVVTPEGLGTPVAVYVTDPSVGSIKDRVVEFDFDTADYGRVVVEEAVPEVPVADWQKYVDLLLSQNGDPQLHGSISSSTIRGGQVALLTTSEDGSQSDIRWLENDSIEIYVRGPSLTIDQCMQIAEKL